MSITNSPFLRANSFIKPTNLVYGGFLCGSKCKAQADMYRAEAEAKRREAEVAEKMASAEIKFKESERLRYEQMAEFEKLMQGQSLQLSNLTANAQAEALSVSEEDSDKNIMVLAGVILAVLVVALFVIKK